MSKFDGNKSLVNISVQENPNSVRHYITRAFIILIPNTKASARPIQKRLAISSHRIQAVLCAFGNSALQSGRHSFAINPFKREHQEEVPWAAGTALQLLRKSAAASAAQHHCFLLCWPKRRNTKAAGCCCCYSTAAGSAVARSRAAGWFAGGCKSPVRGLEVCDREPSLCHGTAGNRAFCDGER
jgi:hypothetical protein